MTGPGAPALTAGQVPANELKASELAAIGAILAATGVPVPPTVALCADESVIGCPFAVWAYVPGRTIQSRADLDAVRGTLPGARPRRCARMTRRRYLASTRRSP
jgi:aminoglycoside phosphotransferase (APT) family kinase protein